jgi:endonuclease/exonuclease/phosphatase family metal-dependent hydrolase
MTDTLAAAEGSNRDPRPSSLVETLPKAGLLAGQLTERARSTSARWKSSLERSTRRPASDPGPEHPDLSFPAQVPPRSGRSLRLFSLNIAHGRRTSTHQALLPDEATRANVSAIGKVLRQVEPDVAGLQEADGPSAWSGNFDHVAVLAEQANLESHYRGDHNPFGSRRFPLTSGTALLSSWPLEETQSHRFGTTWRDTKGFVVARVRVPHWDDVEIDVVSVHLDFLRPKLRRQQILHMTHALIHRRRPLVILGDLNACWQREPSSLTLLRDALGLRPHLPDAGAPTFPVHRPRRRLDWILVSEELDFVDHYTLRTPLSDHLGLVADLVLT